MLTLTRHIDESIVITSNFTRNAQGHRKVVLDGTEVMIRVVQMRDGKVRIGIDAPESLAVMRGELVEDFEDKYPVEDPERAEYNRRKREKLANRSLSDRVRNPESAS